MFQPKDIADLQNTLRAGNPVRPRGGGTKPALSAPRAGWQALDLSRLRGLVEYNPGEYTFTALAGTPVAEIQAALAEHGQYLPFDPLFAERGATLGGAVASGLSGPGRYRYGGLRDFILGVRFVDGRGEVVRGGGKVVKNAAGFDTPKLMVGSLGMFGVLVELTFKVFPAAPAHVTVQHTIAPLEAALEALYRVHTARIEIDSLDCKPAGGGLRFWVRLAGLPEGLPARAERVRELLGGGSLLQGEAESKEWESIRNFNTQGALVKIPITPKRIPAIEDGFTDADRHYSAGGNLVWLTSETLPPALHQRLCDLGLSGLVVAGNTESVRIGARTGQALESRVKQVFDPNNLLPTH